MIQSGRCRSPGVKKSIKPTHFFLMVAAKRIYCGGIMIYVWPATRQPRTTAGPKKLRCSPIMIYMHDSSRAPLCAHASTSCSPTPAGCHPSPNAKCFKQPLPPLCGSEACATTTLFPCTLGEHNVRCGYMWIKTGSMCSQIPGILSYIVQPQGNKGLIFPPMVSASHLGLH